MTHWMVDYNIYYLGGKGSTFMPTHNIGVPAITGSGPLSRPSSYSSQSVHSWKRTLLRASYSSTLGMEAIRCYASYSRSHLHSHHRKNVISFTCLHWSGIWISASGTRTSFCLAPSVTLIQNEVTNADSTSR